MGVFQVIWLFYCELFFNVVAPFFLVVVALAPLLCWCLFLPSLLLLIVPFVLGGGRPCPLLVV